MFRKLKSKKGFTLTELIIVIAILGILAAVLVPSMMSVVGDANQSVANSSASTVFQTAQAAWTNISAVEGKTIGAATYYYKVSDKKWFTNADLATGEVTAGYAKDFVDKISESIGSSVKTSDKISIEVTASGIKKVTYERASKVGQYPQS